MIKEIYKKAMVAWSVERLLHKKCHLLAVDRIMRGDVYMQLRVILSAIRLGSYRPNHLTQGNGPPEIQGSY